MGSLSNSQSAGQPIDQPRLIWEASTGYDLFVSLHVLDTPEKFALRGAWAKGVRTRLPAEAREFFEETSHVLLAALPWVYSLDGPRDAETILDALAALTPEQRFSSFLKSPEIPESIGPVLDQVAARGAWTAQDREAILASGSFPMKSEAELGEMLDLWARTPALGTRTLESLVAYYDVFFAEEELRIRPALEEAVLRGQEMAARLPFPDLLAELSEGIRFENEQLVYPEWVMAPSFWITPRIFTAQVSPSRTIFFHGGRPADASLVPGEAVPDALFVALKALADPTRLRILHYLEEQPQTPSELAKTLRLRAPTVIHHLNSLRLAGLVYVAWEKGDKRYAARTSRIAELYLQLRRYLGISDIKLREEGSGRPPYMA